MPTYSYECRSCGNEFDFFQRITEPPLERCPKCNGPVRRKIGAGAGIIFKGSGFYATDYRSPDYKSRKKSEAGSPAPAKKGSEGDSSTGTKPSSPEPSSSGGGDA